MKRQVKQGILCTLLAACFLSLFLFVTMGSSSAPGELICGIEQHQHDVGCYDVETIRTFSCEYDVHRHSIDAGCYDTFGNLVCMKATFVLHEHDDSCYIDGVQVCWFDEIYEDFEKLPVCGFSDHLHGDACYESRLICDIDDGLLLIDDAVDDFDDFESESDDGDLDTFVPPDWLVPEDENFESDGVDGGFPAHVHDENCYVRVLACEEHVHDVDCFDDVPVLFKNGEIFLVPNEFGSYGMIDIFEHFHDESCFTTVDRSVGGVICGLEPHVHDDTCFAKKVFSSDLENRRMVLNDFIDRVVLLTGRIESCEYDGVPDILKAQIEDLKLQYAALDLSDMDDADLQSLADAWNALDVAWREYDARNSLSELDILLQSFCDSVSQLISDVEAGVYDEDMLGLKTVCTQLESDMQVLDACDLSGEQREVFEECAGTLKYFLEFLSVNGMSLDTVTFSPAVYNNLIGASANETLFVQYRIVRTDSGLSGAVVMPENPSVSTSGTGVGYFDALTFNSEGVYSFDITCVSGSGRWRYDNRTWKLDVTVESGADGLSVSDVRYFLVENPEQISSERADFITVSLARSGLSSADATKVEELMSQMTLEQKVGQLFLLHYPGNGAGSVADAQALVTKYQPGGMLVFAAMFEGSNPSAVQKKIADTQSVSAMPMLFTVDEEGGTVTRVSQWPAYGHSRFLSPQGLKAQGGLAAVTSDAREKHLFLANLGLNVNHAPVADVSGPDGYIYARTYGGDGIENAAYVQAYMEGASGTGVGSTMKHFPGYGGTTSNTHNGFAINDLTLYDFMYNDLLPFYAGMAAGGQAVMVTHNTIRCLDGENPASLSPAVYELLRNEMQFDGVAMTDDLGMSAVTGYAGSGQASLMALMAGADMAMTSTPDKDFPVVMNAVQSGKLSVADVEVKCRRILTWKAELGLLDNVVLPEDVGSNRAEYKSADGKTSTTGDFDSMLQRAVSSGGTVTLLDNCSSDKTYVLAKAVTLDLNGYHLRYSQSDFVTVNSGGTLTLADSSGVITDVRQGSVSVPTGYAAANRLLSYSKFDGNGIEYSHIADFSKVGSVRGSGTFVVLSGGRFNLNNGLVDGLQDVNAETAVVVNSGTLAIAGGAIVNHTVSLGSGVTGGGVQMLSGSFTMTGGYIVNNSADVGGGVWFNSGVGITVTDGVVGYNSAVDGGGLYCQSHDKSFTNVVVTGNVATDNGGGVYVDAGYTHFRNVTNISYNTATNGGGIYVSGGSQARVYLYDNTGIYHNHAYSTGGGLCNENLDNTSYFTLRDSIRIEWNSADVIAGGVYCRLIFTGSNSLTNLRLDGGQPVVLNNTADGNPSNFYLRKGQYITVISRPNQNARVDVYPEEQSEYIIIADVSQIDFYEGDTSHFRSDVPGKQVALEANRVVLIGAQSINTSVYIYIDNQPYEIGKLTLLYTDDDGHNYVLLDEILPYMTNYAFDFEKSREKFCIGVNPQDGTLLFADLAPFEIDGKWYQYLPDGIDAATARLSLLANGLDEGGAHSFEEVAYTDGYFTVRISDVYGIATPDVKDESRYFFMPAGGMIEFELPWRDEPYDWKANDQDDGSDFLFDVIQDGDVAKIIIADIHSPATISSGGGSNVMYTVQYYGDMKRLVTYPSTDSTNTRIQVIDTTGRDIPRPGHASESELNVIWLRMVETNNNELEMSYELGKLYEDRRYVYSDVSTLLEVDRLYTDDHYECYEFWVLKSGRNADSIKREDWDIYNKDALGLSSIYELRLTNSLAFADFENVIYLEPDSVVRFVYRASESQKYAPVTFYDYDITDGYVYSDAAKTNKQATSTVGKLSKAYVNTVKQGINSVTNYSGLSSDAHLAFGNANTKPGWESETVGDRTINQYNRGGNAYRGCSFGLVSGLDGNGNIIYASGVQAPNLFAEGDAIGKTVFDDYELVFDRYGDTYTLSAVSGTSATGLKSFTHPTSASGTTYSHILTNNFWPADSFPSAGADGHDPVFGGVPGVTGLPDSDDGQTHNSYFGMTLTIEFALPESYVGDLNYCFYGDDDMWAFLDGQLVVDIGGVHSSVGEYVDLWDYIEQGDTSKHVLKLFYTERGASGSTCWMHFTIPEAHFVNDVWDSGYGSVRLQKTVKGSQYFAPSQFEFDVSILDRNGNIPNMDISYVLYAMNGAPNGYGILENGQGTLSLVDGQMLSILYIPDGYTFTITEKEYDCDTKIFVNGEIVEGRTLTSVIEKNVAVVGEWVNTFDGGLLLPSTGIEFTPLMMTCIGVGILSVFCGGYWIYDRKYKYHGKRVMDKHYWSNRD